MAYFVSQYPLTYAPVYNPMYAAVYSTNFTQPNIEYICDVYVSGQTFAGGASYLRLKAPIQTTNGIGRAVFDLSPVLKPFLTGDVGDSEYGFQQCSNSILAYTMKFGEMYGPSSGVTVYADQVVSSTYYAFNGSLGTLEWKDFAVNNYVCNTPVSIADVGLLTNSPSSGVTISVSYLEDAWAYTMSQTSGVVKYANITTYSGTLTNKTELQSYKVMNHAYHDTTTVANRYLRFPIGYNMDSIAESSVITTANPAVPIIQSADLWEVYFCDSQFRRVTESIFVVRNDDCSQYTRYRLHFKNKWGAYDSFTFVKASQISTDITRYQYEKSMGENKSASSYTYAKTDRFQTSFYTSTKQTITVNSDWITEDQDTWLEEMIASNDVRYEDSSGNLIPINILETTHVRRKHITDKVFNIQLKFQYSFGDIRQGA